MASGAGPSPSQAAASERPLRPQPLICPQPLGASSPSAPNLCFPHTAPPPDSDPPLPSCEDPAAPLRVRTDNRGHRPSHDLLLPHTCEVGTMMWTSQGRACSVRPTGTFSASRLGRVAGGPSQPTSSVPAAPGWASPAPTPARVSGRRSGPSQRPAALHGSVPRRAGARPSQCAGRALGPGGEGQRGEGPGLDAGPTCPYVLFFY